MHEQYVVGSHEDDDDGDDCGGDDDAEANAADDVFVNMLPLL